MPWADWRTEGLMAGGCPTTCGAFTVLSDCGQQIGWAERRALGIFIQGGGIPWAFHLEGEAEGEGESGEGSAPGADCWEEVHLG